MQLMAEGKGAQDFLPEMPMQLCFQIPSGRLFPPKRVHLPDTPDSKGRYLSPGRGGQRKPDSR